MLMSARGFVLGTSQFVSTISALRLGQVTLMREQCPRQ
jgi:hypothetical protein